MPVFRRSANKGEPLGQRREVFDRSTAKEELEVHGVGFSVREFVEALA